MAREDGEIQLLTGCGNGGAIRRALLTLDVVDLSMACVRKLHWWARSSLEVCYQSFHQPILIDFHTATPAGQTTSLVAS